MKLQLILLLACVGTAVHCSSIKRLISQKSDVSGNSASFGIYDGKTTTIKDHPSLASLNVNGIKRSSCQGTIIDEEHVLTIADCVIGYTPSAVSVVVASEDGVQGIKFKVDNIIIHPNYTGEDYDYNYALLKVKGTFKWSDKVKAITLPKTAARPNTEMVVAGWGDRISAEVNGQQKTQLTQGTMTWLDKNKCKEFFQSWGVTWTDRMACAYNQGKTTLCNHDWADAFINKDVFYGMFQAAFGQGFCSSKAMPLLLSDAFTVLDWIKNNSGAKSEDD